MEHIPRAHAASQLHAAIDSCMLLDICLCVVYMFVLPVYLHAQEMHYQQIIFSILQKDKSSAVLVIFAAIMCILTCLFVTLSSLICSCHREYLSIGSVRVLVRASELAHAYANNCCGCDYNRRDQQKA